MRGSHTRKGTSMVQGETQTDIAATASVPSQTVPTTAGSSAARLTGTPPRRGGRMLLTVLLAVAVVAAVLAAAAGGASTPTDPVFGDAGALVRWGLPVLVALSWTAAAVVAGSFLLVGVLLPSSGSKLPTGGAFALRRAGAAAVAWAVLQLVIAWFTLADVSGLPPLDVLGDSRAWGLLFGLSVTRAQLSIGLIALLIAVWVPFVRSAEGASALLVVSLATVLPTVVTGHSATSANHELAITAIFVHLVPILLWVGGIVALALHARVSAAGLARGVTRFSPIAAVCLLTVTVSGLVSGAVRLTGFGDVLGTDYGRLLVTKTVLIGAIALAGLYLRNRVIPALASANPVSPLARGLFARWAGVEAGFMVATLGVAAALARTPEPPTAVDPNGLTVAEELLGYRLPPEPTLSRLLFTWHPDPTFVLLAVTAVGLYLWGAARLHRRGDSWPVLRTGSWLAGWAVLVLVTCGGIGWYSPVLFSIHMLQHMVLSMLVPILLLLAAPVTMALRALPVAPRGERGPRELLTALLESRYAQFFSHPLVAFAVFVSSFYVLYFTGLFELLMRSHVGHIAMSLHFVLVGAIFYWTIIGVDPAPRRVPHMLRLLLLLLSFPFHAFFAIAIMSSDSVIAQAWYAALARPYATDLLADQRSGAGLGWALGEIPALILAVALAMQWARADERRARRTDRAADRNGDADLVAYNAMLTGLAHRDKPSDQ